VSIPARAALIAFVLYLAGAFALGDRFPFSRYDMYAASARRDRGAVPLFLADGVPTEIHDWDRFAGLDGTLVPDDLPTSLRHAIDEAERWIAQHRAPEGAPPGPVRIQVAVRLLSVDDGVLRESTRIVAEGTAWPR
jgi:hypothetical protein